MRIVHVLHSHGYGGAENHVVIMMRGQMAQGHAVTFAGPLDSWLGQACQQHGIAAVHLRMSGLFDLASHWALRRLLRRVKADVVHGHLIRGSFYAGWAGRIDRPPLAICSAHTTTALKHMGRCKHIIADSQAIKTRLVAHGYRDEAVSVIYAGVPDAPAQDRAAIRRELGLDEDCVAVVHAGRFMVDKGQDTLVQAMDLVRNPRVRLFLIGDDATDFGRLVHRLPQAAGRVTYLGFRSDVQRLLQGFDVYVQPSRREGLPLAVSEAFAAGLAVVASTVGGMPEVVQHERTGLQVPPDDPPALASAISRLADEPHLAGQLARSARAFYEDHLTEHAMVARTLALYETSLTPPN